MNRQRTPERSRHPKQPALFWWLLAFNVIMYTLVIPLRML